MTAVRGRGGAGLCYGKAWGGSDGPSTLHGKAGGGGAGFGPPPTLHGRLHMENAVSTEGLKGKLWLEKSVPLRKRGGGEGG